MAGTPKLRRDIQVLDAVGIEGLADLHRGGLGYREIAELLDVAYTNIHKWLRRNPGHKEMMDQARADRGSYLADEALEIADGAKPEAGHVQKAKLQVDVRQWLAARLNPELAGKKGGDVNLTIQSLHLEALRMTPEETPEVQEARDVKVITKGESDP